MRIVFFINTPAQAHTWRYTIKKLIKDGHQVKILVRNYDSAPVLLDKFGFDYEIYIDPRKYRCLGIFQIIPHVWNSYRLVVQLKPQIIVGFGIIEALTSLLLKKPCVIFIDSEPVPLQNYLNKLFTHTIITPDCFRGDFGAKHIRILGYKELAYLHPKYFQPDPRVLNELGLDSDEKYVILRFNAFDAVHDIGRHGFSLNDKYRLVRELEKYARVYISSEKPLPNDLLKYNLPISFERLHHALYYAQLLVCDTGTIATEAAILGTPAITCFSSVKQFGNFMELEQKYNLIYTFCEPDNTIKKAIELIQTYELKKNWQHKRNILLKDKINVTEFMSWFIKNYPGSFRNIKQNPKLQYNFRF